VTVRITVENVDKAISARRLRSESQPAQDVMQAVLDALPSPAAILDESGTILYANVPWCRFAEENAFVGLRYGVESNYLTTCRTTTGPGADIAHEVIQGIERVITGDEPHFSYQYPCHGPAETRWFRLCVTPVAPLDGTVRFLVAHDEGAPIRLAEESLYVKEERHRRLLEATDVLPWEADGETWQFTYVGPQAPKLFGYPVEQWYQKDFWIDHLDPRDRTQAIEFCLAHSQVDQQYDFEYRMVSADGRVVWVHDFVSVTSEGGRPKALWGFMADITERKRTAEQFRLVVEATPSGMLMVDQAGTIRLVNAELEKQFGYSRQELLGQPVELLIPERFRAQHPTHRANFFAAPSVLAMGIERELLGVRKNGSEMPIEIGISPVTISEDNYVLASIIDITDRKRTENALRESEKRFRLMADTAPVMVWMSGPDKRCMYFNKGWLEFTGRPIERELGDGWVENVHPDDLASCLEIYSAAFDARKDFIMEYRLRRADGEYRWIWDTGVPRFEASGYFAGYIGSCKDITDRKQTEDSLREISGRLISAQEEERGRIARELHDDMNQRVALMAIELEQLEQQAPISAAQLRDSIHQLLNKSRQLSADLHTLCHSLHPSKLEHVGLATAIRSFCDEIAHRLDLRIDCVYRDVPRDLPKNIALCLYRVVQEAIHNVVKHSGARDATVEITGSPSLIMVSVSDSGVGFGPDSTAVNAGLGLVSMRERARLVGGEFSIQSQPSQGTRIEVRVPLAPAG
jgi:PAS domain S-box-containing protein